MQAARRVLLFRKNFHLCGWNIRTIPTCPLRMEKSSGKEVNNMRHFFTRLCEEEDGISTVEIILIIVGIFTPYYGVGIRCMA